MPQPEFDLSREDVSVQPQKFRENLRRLDRREWTLWSTTVLVLVLLTVAVASFAFPALLSKEESSYSFDLNQAVRSLVGLILLFSVYLVYQQSTITRMRSQLADQFQSISRVETLTAEVYKLAALDQLTGLYNRRSGENSAWRKKSHGPNATTVLSTSSVGPGWTQADQRSVRSRGGRPGTQDDGREIAKSDSRIRLGSSTRRRRIHGVAA